LILIFASLLLLLVLNFLDLFNLGISLSLLFAADLFLSLLSLFELLLHPLFLLLLHLFLLLRYDSLKLFGKNL
jgi:hypothetical protein